MFDSGELRRGALVAIVAFDLCRHILLNHKSKCKKIFVTQGVLTPVVSTIRAGIFVPGKTSSMDRLADILYLFTMDYRASLHTYIPKANVLRAVAVYFL